MLNFIAQAGHAATIVDFTSDVSLLLTGLVGVTWFAAGMLVVAAIHEWRSQVVPTPDEATLPMSVEMEHRHAA
jgi:hypothetical protein